MKYVLQITHSPQNGNASALGLSIAKSLLKCGHQLDLVFFYNDGVLQGNQFNYPAHDEPHFMKQWQCFAKENGVKLALCVAAAQRRGVVDHDSSVDSMSYNLAQQFELAGLAQFGKAILMADRVITV